MKPTPFKLTRFSSLITGLLAGLALLLSGCESMPPPSVANVGYEFDSNFNFESVGTFAIVRPESPSPISPILRKNILNETANRLTRMGYTEVAKPADADILVSVHGTSKQVVDSVTYSNVYYTRTYRRSSWIYFGGYPSTYITTSEEGTLLIDIADAKSKELVWRGWGIRKFTLDTKVSTEQIQESVKRLLLNFPPPSR
ncbi:hypothetical protein VDG1235_2750 [Verrucomicrobiia bacterium DG1235]|nr:hypothetical protein VDG1235_2750 [Verrucomicrobiae bacterium DG1235]